MANEALIDTWKSLTEIKYEVNNYKLNDKKTISCYAATKDLEALAPNQHLIHHYQTHILPQPFFGNIDNPDIILLALNPKFDYEKSYAEHKELLDRGISVADYITNTNIIFDNTSSKYTFNWWKEVFDGALPENYNFENLLGNIGIFNLCGYHSKSFNKLPKACFKENISELPTQTALRNHLKKLMLENPNRLILVIWGNDYWKSFFNKIEKGYFNNHILPNMILVNQTNEFSNKPNKIISKCSAYNYYCESEESYIKDALKKYINSIDTSNKAKDFEILKNCISNYNNSKNNNVK